MFILTMHVKSDLLISENPIYLAGGWGWRLIYIGRAHPPGRAHPLEDLLNVRARALEDLLICFIFF